MADTKKSGSRNRGSRSTASADQVGYVYALSTCAVGNPSGRGFVKLKRGEVWHAGDPLVQARPELFAADPPLVHTSGPRPYVPPVEQATKAPGERKSL